MINIIKLKCPHCGVQGQLVLPEGDTILVGPCPECNNMVVIFAGKALALDTALMSRASKEEAFNHLYEVICAHVRERLDSVFGGAAQEQPAAEAAPAEETVEQAPPAEKRLQPHISSREMQQFVKDELPLLDNVDYFRAIFG
jgi:hypothetical protein